MRARRYGALSCLEILSEIKLAVCLEFTGTGQLDGRGDGEQAPGSPGRLCRAPPQAALGTRGMKELVLRTRSPS